ncbi:MAG: bifunctional transaldolase/phosoglucose isomerase [Chloroflexi bacterium]|nr:bifunctional transaldolase/phosoglucose isomerase [Chloroflexota bacterium]
MNQIQQTQSLGQSVWIDYIRRGMFPSGDFQRLLDLGITGVTANPTIFEKAIAGSTDYDQALPALVRAGKNAKEIYEALAIEDIREAADRLRPAYERTAGADGYVSLECNPWLAYDTQSTLAEARRLFAALDRPNVLIKVPATAEGIPAIRQLISEGININITLIFSLEVYRQVRDAYLTGMEKRLAIAEDVSHIASVASFFLSRVDTAVDAQLEERIKQGQAGLKALLGKAAVANAKLAYQAFKDTFASERFKNLRVKGARVQRPLWASTSTKNPAYHDLMYVEPLIGPDTVNTMPPATINAFLDHGHAVLTLAEGVAEAKQTLQALAQADIDMEAVTAKLTVDGVRLFAESFDKLLASIGEKQARLATQAHIDTEVSLGPHVVAVEKTLDDLERREVTSRIWRQDHTVWKPEPKEITNRLGWLTVTELMAEQVPAVTAFAREIKETGFRHAVLLGMGGSSLGPETLRQTFGSAPGYPKLIVLDSILPATVQAVTASIDLRHTLFLVSSKSGATIEVTSLYRYFRKLVEQALGNKAGQSFVAITDSGTPLVSLAEKDGFRRVFLNPSNIGGRYSVLSYFGLVPAVLMGVDVSMLLDRAERMREGCASCVSAREGQGSRLGAIMGTLAKQGRDKLTLVLSPTITSFGLWVEQLIAESIGKEGKGIIPVAGEPLMSPSDYGDDRLFVYLRLDGDDNEAIDTVMAQVKTAGQPVVTLRLADRYDLGAEFFRWEFATAVAGAVLGINPFDQPNVQEAKDLTGQLLQEYRHSGRLPPVPTNESLSSLLAQAGTGSYLAIMAYIRQMPEVDRALADLRRQVAQQHRIATTLGYGPRFLHSTGQLHKGGPNSGLFVQLTADHNQDVSVPGEDYTLGILADAQAAGDFRALAAKGRPVIRVHLGKEHSASILRLAEKTR